jgi:hypothetical protein
MNDDDILRMAIECQLVTTGNREGFYSEALMRFARMAMQHEREACANIARDTGNATEPDDWALDKCYEIETAIRARGNT